MVPGILWSAAMMGDIHLSLGMEWEESQRDFLLEDLMDIGLYDSDFLHRGSWEERSFRYTASSTSTLYDHISSLEENNRRIRTRVQAVEQRAAALERQAQDCQVQQERESALWCSAMSLEMVQMREAMELKEERVRSLEAWVGRTEERLDRSEGDHNHLLSTVSDDSFLQMKLIQLVEWI